MNNKLQIPVGVSNRHIHVTSEHLEILFGKGYNLTKYKDLTQKGQFAANEFVTLVTCKSSIENIRILGPVRSWARRSRELSGLHNYCSHSLLIKRQSCV